MPIIYTAKRMTLLAGYPARKAAGQGGLTPQRADVLASLVDRPMRQKDLRFEIGVSPSVLSRMLTALELDGLLVREPDPKDRRHLVVRITEMGRERLALARQWVRDSLQRYFPLDHPWRKLRGAESVQFAAELLVMQHFRKDCLASNSDPQPVAEIRNQSRLLTWMQWLIPWIDFSGRDYEYADEVDVVRRSARATAQARAAASAPS